MAKQGNNFREVTMLDPERWGLKYGTKKRMYYYQLHFDFFTDPQIFSLSLGAKLILLDVFKQSLKVNKATFSYCLESACGLLSIPLEDVKAYFTELKTNKIIGLDKRLRTQYIKEHNITEHNIIDIENKTPKPPEGDELPLEVYVDIWNIAAGKSWLPRVQKLTEKRRKLLRAAVKEMPETQHWADSLLELMLSDFHSGKSESGWKADFDWFIQPTKHNYLKFYEQSQNPKPEERLF